MAKKVNPYHVGRYVSILPDYVNIGGDQHDFIDSIVLQREGPNKFKIYDSSGGGLILYLKEDEGEVVDTDTWFLPKRCVKPFGLKKTVLIYDTKQKDN